MNFKFDCSHNKIVPLGPDQFLFHTGKIYTVPERSEEELNEWLIWEGPLLKVIGKGSGK